jgi:hypothetical protein
MEMEFCDGVFERATYVSCYMRGSKGCKMMQFGKWPNQNGREKYDVPIRNGPKSGGGPIRTEGKNTMSQSEKPIFDSFEEINMIYLSSKLSKIGFSDWDIVFFPSVLIWPPPLFGPFLIGTSYFSLPF